MNELPDYVVDANAQRDLYYNNRKFREAQEIVIQSGLEHIDESPRDQLALFLDGRGISHNARLEDLVRKEEPKVSLLGATFHFSRKFFTTSHDCGEDIQDPLPLIQNVLDAIAASDDKHAAKILEELSDISSKEPTSQRKVVAIVAEILPELTRDYRTSLGNLGHLHRPASPQYNSEKGKLDQLQMTLLDKMIGYIRQVIRTYQEPSFDGFKKYAGYGNNSAKASAVVTVEYIEGLLGSNDPKYQRAINTLESQAGTLLKITFEHGSERRRKILQVVAGPEGNPKTYHLDYTRSDGASRLVKPLILAMMDHVIGNQLLPVSHKNATSTNRPNVEKYF